MKGYWALWVRMSSPGRYPESATVDLVFDFFERVRYSIMLPIGPIALFWGLWVNPKP